VSNTKRKFIESHWLTFAVKGAISVVAGLCLMFTRNDDVHLLTQILGWTMFGLAFIEIANVVYRKVRSHNWGFPLFLGLLELGISIALLFTVDPNATDESLIPVRVAILSGYVVFASIVTIVMGFASFKNMTDRFMWVVNGMVGTVLALLMLGGASTANDTTSAYFGAKVLLFGTYLMVNGITDLFFGIHSRDEMAELHAGSRKKTAKKGKK
jgi:uncharacterized membrane protein HdeD (DUF308 family)